MQWSSLAAPARAWQALAPMSVLSTLRSIPPLFGLTLPVAVIAADQLTKWLATRAFGLPMNICALEPDIHLRRLKIEVSPIADLSMYCNQGISWGLLQGDSPIKRWALFAFAAVMVLVLYNLLASARDHLSQWSLALLIGGAVGNAVDRALFGAVTDFVDASDVYFNYVFNVADAAITFGIIGMALVIFRDWRAERAAGPAS